MTKKPLFYKIYFSVIAVFLIALTVALFALGSWLKSYEKAQPVNIIDGIVESGLKEADADYLINSCKLKVSPYEKESVLRDFLKQSTENKALTSALCRTLPEGCDTGFVVKSDDTPFLNIYLKKDASSSSLLPTYNIMWSEFAGDTYKRVTVTAPHDAELFLNGKEVESSLREDLAVSDFVKDYLKNENAVKQQTAVIDNLLSDDVTVEAKLSGKEATVTQSGNSYYVHSVIDGEVKKNVQTVALEGTMAFAKYLQTDASLAEVGAYFDKSSTFYKSITSTYVDHILEHTYTFTDIRNEDVFKYSDNIYSCYVEFTHVLKRNGMLNETEFKKYVFVKKSGNSYLIIDIKSPEEN